MGGALTILCTLDFSYNNQRNDRPDITGEIYKLLIKI